ETDKATMEVEAIDEGVLAKIVVPEGAEDVPVNDVIAVLAGEGEDLEEAAAAAGAAAAKKAERPAASGAPSPQPSPQKGEGAGRAEGQSQQPQTQAPKPSEAEAPPQAPPSLRQGEVAARSGAGEGAQSADEGPRTNGHD